MRGGALLDNLRALGLEPSDIDTVLLTHLHADHVGWIGNESADGVPTFPNAEYWLNDAEWEFWNRPENSTEAVSPRPHQLALTDARRRPLVEGSEPLDGVTAVATMGHTPGHFGFPVLGSRTRAFIVGDAVHCPGEILHPDVVWVGDQAPAEAVDTRRAIADRVGDGDGDVVLVGPHFPDAIFRSYRRSAAQPMVEVIEGVTCNVTPGPRSFPTAG